jgi:5-methylthioribose kinase
MDIERPHELEIFLRTTGRLTPAEPFAMRVLTGGVSNRTVLLERPGGENWVLKQALEKLRVNVDWFSHPERIHREAAGMNYLHIVAPQNITRLIFEDKTEHVIAMEAVDQPHENWKAMLLAGKLEGGHVEQFATLLATIHRESFLANRDGSVAAMFAERCYFENLRLEPYYLYTAERVPEAASFLQQLVTEMRLRLMTLVHGDYSPKNVLVHNNKLVLLDHEVIHFGDPAFDVGFALTHLLSKAHHLTAHRPNFAEAALHFWRCYAEGVRGLAFYEGLETYVVRHTLACSLARVAGRSPLEYLSEREQATQEMVVVSLLSQNLGVPQLVADFTEGVRHVNG